jgi:Outer membrane protein beta-barrel domain
MRYALWVALATFLAPAAEAQPADAYYGLAIGSFDYQDSEGFAPNSIGDTVDAYHLMVGYKFNDHIAVEGGYGKTGTIHDVVDFTDPFAGPITVDFKTKFSILTVRLLGLLTFDSGVTLLGGVGYATMTQRVTLDAPPFGTSSGKSSGGESSLYVGVQYDWDRVALRLAYEKYYFGGGVDVSEPSLAFLYKL